MAARGPSASGSARISAASIPTADHDLAAGASAGHAPPLPGAKLAAHASHFPPTLVLQLSVMPIGNFI